MRLDKQTDFALRVLMCLGANPDRLVTIAEVATRFGISEAHLMKVVHQLGRGGFIETVRGRSGGIRMPADGASVRLGDVVRRMERDLGPVECLRASGGNCLITPCCRLRSVLSKATAAFLAILDDYTVADLVRDNEGVASLLAMRAA
jgi:Rrf2 family nitric oxide-sensitive transcriptional repressor